MSNPIGLAKETTTGTPIDLSESGTVILGPVYYGDLTPLTDLFPPTNTPFRDMLSGRRQMTQEERDDYVDRMRREAAAAQAEIRALYAASHDIATGLRRAVMELHSPRFGEFGTTADCGGCEFGGWEGEPPNWPCSTYTLAAEWTE